MKKLRLLAIIPNRDDATSFYRAIGPLTDLTRRVDWLEVMEPSKVTWAVIAASCDVLFMQRPFSDDHLLIAQIAQSQGKPVWIDYDDDLFTVPRSNPASKIYSSDKIKKNIATLCTMADVVTVSTQTLHNALQERGPTPLCKDCRVIRNALPMHIIREPRPIQKNRERIVMWRGSSTHHEDLDSHLDDMQKLMKEFPRVTFHFQGDAYWRLVERSGTNAVFAPPIDILEYFNLIATLQPTVMMVPLMDNAFNRSKSNIAQLEGIWAGALPVVPNMPEWISAPGFLYNKDTGSMYDKVTTALSMSDAEINECVSHSRKAIMERYTLEAVNGGRLDVLRDLFHKREYQKPVS